MISILQTILPTLVLIFTLCVVVGILALIFKNSWGKGLVSLAGEHALGLGLAVSIIAVAGSLFYSNVIGFPPCDLCWWQRVLIYPQLILFLTALKFKDRGVFRYSWRLAVLGIIVSTYHLYVQMGGDPLIPCSATVTCTKVYVYAYNFVTIPSMALVISIAFVLLALANRFRNNG